ncbi:MAG TPA: molybdopterin-dependent oxidoreductase, partial [Exilispira sp.]|nr:molybdopterin-dependent oxidoreductase [Exilispira sp.]
MIAQRAYSKIEDTLFISIVRSTIQRGKIISIQLPHIPRGYFIFNHNHIPGSNIWHYFLDDWKFLADDMVNFIGEPILIIAGPSLPVCHELSSKVIVRYEPMQPINSVADSFDENIEAIYSSASSTKTPAFDKSMGKNLFKQLGYLSGDKKALPSKSLNILKYINHFFYENENKLVSKTNNILKSDKFTEFFVTDRQEHAYLEPQGFIAFYEDDVLVLKGSIQCPFYVLKAITELLNLPEDKIRIQQAATGGAFGGKEEFPSIVASFAALVTYLTKKPSKIIFERTEDIEVTTKRHPSYILLRTKMGKNGKIKSIESDIILDAGAYCGISPVVLARS